MIRVEEYLTEEGNSPFANWFDELDAQAANKVNTYLTRVAQGNTSSLKPIKAPSKKYELTGALVIGFT